MTFDRRSGWDQSALQHALYHDVCTIESQTTNRPVGCEGDVVRREALTFWCTKTQSVGIQTSHPDGSLGPTIQRLFFCRIWWRGWIFVDRGENVMISWNLNETIESERNILKRTVDSWSFIVNKQNISKSYDLMDTTMDIHRMEPACMLDWAPIQWLEKGFNLFSYVSGGMWTAHKNGYARSSSFERCIGKRSFDDHLINLESNW